MKTISIVLGHSVILPPEKTGGAEKVMYWVFNEMKPKEGYRINLVCRGNLNKKSIVLKRSNKNIIFYDGYDWNQSKVINIINAYRWIWKVKEEIKKSDLVIHLSLAGPLLNRIFWQKNLIAFNDQRGTKWMKLFIPFFSIDYLFAISNIVYKSWKDIYHRKSRVIYNCVDTNLFLPVKRYTLDTVSAKNYSIIFVGRITNEKGIIYLLKAFKILVSKFENIKLRIVGPWEKNRGGNPAYFKICKQYTEDNNLTKNVSFLGEKKTSDLVNILHTSHIMVVSSIWEEAFGIVNVEALSTGLPVVGFRIGAIPEIIIEGYNGFMAESVNHESLAVAISNHINLSLDQKKQMESNCIKSVQKFSAKNIAADYLDTFYEVLNDR